MHLSQYLTNNNNATRWEVAQLLLKLGFEFTEDDYLSSVEFDYELLTKNGWVVGFVSSEDLLIVNHPLASFEGLALCGEDLTEAFLEEVIKILS